MQVSINTNFLFSYCLKAIYSPYLGNKIHQIFKNALHVVQYVLGNVCPIIISPLGEFQCLKLFSFKDNCVLANSLQGEAASVRRVKLLSLFIIITVLLFIKKETCFSELCQCFKKLNSSDLITDKCPEKINCITGYL